MLRPISRVCIFELDQDLTVEQRWCKSVGSGPRPPLKGWSWVLQRRRGPRHPKGQAIPPAHSSQAEPPTLKHFVEAKMCETFF